MLKSILTLSIFSSVIKSEGIFSVQCPPDHLLNDDPIMHPNQQNFSSLNQFFGNPSATAFSNPNSLALDSQTKCDVKSDSSSYWVPQLRRMLSDGSYEIINPDFQRTYYRNNDQNQVKTNPIPLGLQMLIGDQYSTSVQDDISYSCTGSRDTTTAPTECALKNGKTQFNIYLHYPDCWDGVHYEAEPSSCGVRNLAHSQPHAVCPEGYPIKLPFLHFILQYQLGSNGDLSTAELSVDPVAVDGVLTPAWSGLYSAHGAIISAMNPNAMKYAVDHCLNQDLDCGNNIPAYYEDANDDVVITASGETVSTGANLELEPGSTFFAKMKVPEETSTYEWGTGYLRLRYISSDIASGVTIKLPLYSATVTWDESSNLPTMSDCLTTNQIGTIEMKNNKLDVWSKMTDYVKGVIDEGGEYVAVCCTNIEENTKIVFESKEGLNPASLILMD